MSTEFWVSVLVGFVVFWVALAPLRRPDSSLANWMDEGDRRRQRSRRAKRHEPILDEDANFRACWCSPEVKYPVDASPIGDEGWKWHRQHLRAVGMPVREYMEGA